MKFHPKIQSLRLLTTVVAICLSLSACSNKTLDYRNAEINNGKVYSQGDNSPFSGKLTNVSLPIMTAAQPGFAKIVRVINVAMPYATVGDIALNAVCDVHLSDGLLDGKAVCKTRESDIVRAEMSFSDGALDGALKLNDSTGNNLFSKAEFKAGQPDGKQQVYNPSNGKLVFVAPWSHGAITGTEKGYDGDTGKQVLKIERDDDGRFDGDYKAWSPDGTLIHKLNYVHGKKDGVEESFYPDTGKLSFHSEWKDGHQDGVIQNYDHDGKLESEEHYAAGERVYLPEEAQSIADRRSQDANFHCMKAAQLNALGESADALQKSEAQCARIAKLTAEAVLRDPGANGLVISVPPAEDDTAPPSTGAATGSAPSSNPPSTNAGGTDACVSSWVAAYQKDRDGQGMSEAVSNDQLGEWQDLCKQGKHPG